MTETRDEIIEKYVGETLEKLTDEEIQELKTLINNCTMEEKMSLVFATYSEDLFNTWSNLFGQNLDVVVVGSVRVKENADGSTRCAVQVASSMDAEDTRTLLMSAVKAKTQEMAEEKEKDVH